VKEKLILLQENHFADNLIKNRHWLMSYLLTSIFRTR